VSSFEIGDVVIAADADGLTFSRDGEPLVALHLDGKGLSELLDFLRSVKLSPVNRRRGFRVPVLTSDLEVRLGGELAALRVRARDLSLSGIFLEFDGPGAADEAAGTGAGSPDAASDAVSPEAVSDAGSPEAVSSAEAMRLAVGDAVQISVALPDLESTLEGFVRRRTKEGVGVVFSHAADAESPTPPPDFSRIVMRLERDWLAARLGTG